MTASDGTIAAGPAASPGRAPDDNVCAVLLAAGEGRRLRPLTARVPKPLCPVGNVALLDRALHRVAGLGLSGVDSVAVNAAYLSDQIVAHVAGRARMSVEDAGPLGTAGGVGRLLGWIDGRAALVGNTDAYLADPDRPPGPDIAALLDGWDGRTVRLLTRETGPGERPEFGTRRFAGFSLLPWAYLRTLTAEPAELVKRVWRPAEAAGELELIGYAGTYVDTGTPADYLAANLHAAGLHPVDLHPVDLHADDLRPADLHSVDLRRVGLQSVGLHRGGDGRGCDGDGGSMVEPTATVTGRCFASVVGAGAVVAGSVTRCVVWPGATVAAGEHLVDVIRAGTDLTVGPGLTVNRV